MNKIAIELKLNQWNYILSVLAHRPFGEVSELIAAIQAQAPKNVDVPPTEE